MKKMIKRVLAFVISAVMLFAASCTHEAETTGTADDVTETVVPDITDVPDDTSVPQKSLDLLTFTPASPSGQVLTEKFSRSRIA